MSKSLLLQYLIPHHLYSRLVACLTRVRQPWLKNLLIRLFLNTYPVDMRQAQEENPYAYPDFNHFFVRALKPELRPIPKDPRLFLSPVDGCIGQVEHLTPEALIHAKGRGFSVLGLLGGHAAFADRFLHGSLMTFYLAPHDYHRVHMPMDGQLTHMIHVPGKLFSVHPSVTNRIPQVFSKNERVIALFDTPMGAMAVILVGAMLVASIETVWAGIITPKSKYARGTSAIRHWHYDQPTILKRGQEMGRFQFGSTVIVLTEKPLHGLPTHRCGQPVQFGQNMATF